MTDELRARPNARPPLVAAPAPFVERRGELRRAEDRLARRETALLARCLDILASDAPAESRLAGVLELLARTVGARRAAVLAGADDDRRVAVPRSPDETDEAALALAAWLDAWAPRPRVERAASGPASVLLVPSATGRDDASGHGVRARTPGAAPPETAVGADHHYACVPVPTSGGVTLGFDFADEEGVAKLEERLPPQLARHAAVALALVTEQIAVERELDARRAGDAERDRYVSSVAHELRTPLTGLSGYLELILGGQVADPADERDFLERSRRIVGSMVELVGDLLELSRLESGNLRLDVAPFSLTEAVTRVVEALAPIALDHGVTLRTTLPPRLRAATGDRRRAEQILTNLVGNALKFAPRDSVVEMVAWFDGPVALLAVRDEGAGIGGDERRRIFERFHRMSGHERVVGTGLGLPIARDLARAMGGDVDVASVPGAGSSFVLALPGPTGVDPGEVGERLRQTVVDEEVRLEEQAVLRALAVNPRARVVPSEAGTRARLRAFDGSGAPAERGDRVDGARDEARDDRPDRETRTSA